MRLVFIYALCEPGTRKIRYIGKTGNMHSRLEQHITRSGKLKTHLGHWISKILKKGLIPRMILLERVPENCWEEAERRHIKAARDSGINIVNSGDGGEGVTLTPEVLKKRRARHPHLSGEKAPFFGRKHSRTTKRRMSKAQLGRKHSLKTRRRISKARLASKINFFGRGPLNPMFGKKRTEESRGKQAKTISGSGNHQFGMTGNKSAVFGKKHSKARRAAQSAYLLGRKRGKYCRKLRKHII